MDKNFSAFKLKAISLLDGRNHEKVKTLNEYFSEFALIRYRVRVEVTYLLFLAKETKIVRTLTPKEKVYLENIWGNFSMEDALVVKEYEAKINHDVKAIEYFLQQKLAKSSLRDTIPFLHFGLTSYDINIPSYALMFSEYRSNCLLPQLKLIVTKLKELIVKCDDCVMLGRTHGQPALPTTMAKELAVFYKRINAEYLILSEHQFEGKLTGAVGNLNALAFVYPDYDWIAMSKKFIKSLGLVPNVVTTQILPYDNWLVFFDSVKRLNNILVNLSQDIWWYICFEYFEQLKKEEEVGSSTMSHKINPITFENAEGNLLLANSLFEFFNRKLSVTRLQRDLSDSTVKRDFGLAFGFTYLAWDSLLSGFARITPNRRKMQEDLDNHWEIFSEGIQTYLRAKGLRQAFEMLKKETRGKTFSKQEMYELIDKLLVSLSDKKNLKISDLSRYLGLAKAITREALKGNI